jgi:erythromycin esterase-like protein
MTTDATDVLERRRALARTLHRPRSCTAQRAGLVRASAEQCRVSVLAVDAKLASFAAVRSDVRTLADQLRACTENLDRALAGLATCLERAQ